MSAGGGQVKISLADEKDKEIQSQAHSGQRLSTGKGRNKTLCLLKDQVTLFKVIISSKGLINLVFRSYVWVPFRGVKPATVKSRKLRIRSDTSLL